MEDIINNMLKDEALKNATRQMKDLKHEVNEHKDMHIDILKDALDDARQERRFIKRITYTLLVVVFCFIIAFVGLYLYSSNQLMESNRAMMDFLNSCDMYSVDQTIDYNSGDISENDVVIR